MMTVSQLLAEKSNPAIYSIEPSATVFQALQRLDQYNIGAILVMECGRLYGILSERDYARKVALSGKNAATVLVQDVMTARVLCVPGSATVEECMSIMTEKHIRHLPVIEESRVIGMVSIGDLVRTVIEQQQYTIEQLERYIYQ